MLWESGLSLLVDLVVVWVDLFLELLKFRLHLFFEFWVKNFYIKGFYFWVFWGFGFGQK
jgi:hypothetical protein